MLEDARVTKDFSRDLTKGTLRLLGLPDTSAT
jgi:hypothetical protein